MSLIMITVRSSIVSLPPPQIHRLKSEPPDSRNVTLFGKRAMVGVIR